MLPGPVLIANRGEIAVRVAATVRRLGLRSVAVFTDADAGAPHADAADVAVRIGEPRAYLDIERLLDAAARTGARAIHPGYGFLSENASFARAVRDAGLIWVGPPPEAIEQMGDKARAKAIARQAGVPVLPDAPVTDVGDLGDLEAVGLPAVVKAVAGGGGKGMRVVREAGALADAVAAAAREAQAAFGDGRVFVERYLDRPRHVEVQVLADAHGSCVSLGERECSLQRRHQKVVEEAPSPAVDPALRERMGAAAVALAQACGYAGAGTVEFLLDASGAFFFLEMNTRLQVEHPVTELVQGLDLVEHQLRVAAGEPLAVAPRAPQGHAIEARLYAEDPAAGFLPATGTVRRWRVPDGVRVDAGVAEGSEVTTHYDPMLAKVIAHGPDRATAIARLDRALADLEVLGVATNAAFTRALLARDDVRAGQQDTGLLERVLADVVPEVPADLVTAGAAALFLRDTAGLEAAGPWARRFDGHGEVRLDGVHARPAPDGALRVETDGVVRRYAVALDGDVAFVARDGHHLELRPQRSAADTATLAGGTLEAPMPGKVLLVHVADGDAVAAGDVLLVLESMKMELAITAPHDGTVSGLGATAPGDPVTKGQALLAVEVAA
jgi:acetyl-CoA/propionyl-CoA carboxylase biotin carboxyl carrier protein